MQKIGLMLLLFACLQSPLLWAETIKREGINADDVESISHYRVFPPPFIDDQQHTTYIRNVVEDKNGYLWVTGADSQISRYDGYELTYFDIPTKPSSGENELLYIYKDADKVLWVGNNLLHKYDDDAQIFTTVDVLDSQFIHTIVDDSNNGLWLGGNGFGFAKYDKKLEALVGETGINKFPDGPRHVTSFAFDQELQILWMSSTQGIYKYSVREETLQHIPSKIDQYFSTFYTRDISLDIKNHALWIATPRGLLRVNTLDNSTKLYIAEPGENQLPINYTTTSLLDSSGNLWVGMEKEGLCLFRYAHDNFVCLPPSGDKENAIPFTTIEDIYEDESGSLWLSLNTYGFARLTPHLEKFSNLYDRIKVPVNQYFKKSFNGITRDNGDIWIATDGGGIQVFNHHTGDFSVLKHDPGNTNSLPSNSVITIAEDHDGNIWMGTWAGGLSKVNPNTMEFTHYRHDPLSKKGSSLAGDNVFHIEVDKSGGLWISVWYHGVQYLDPKSNTFISFLDNPDYSGMKNREVSDIKIQDKTVWVLGASGLERIEKDNNKTEFLFGLEHSFYTSILIDASDRFYIGSSHGFYIYNPQDNTKVYYPLLRGEASTAVYYFHKDENGLVWLGTNNGVMLFDPLNESFVSYAKEDGLVGNAMSQFGEFFTVDGELYIPGLYGVSIVDPQQLPQNLKAPTSLITRIAPMVTDAQEKSLSEVISLTDGLEIPYVYNSLKISFSSLSFVFPNKNTFKYRLLGLSSEFTESNATDRTAHFTNLTPRAYTFEVYAANSRGVWDPVGATFSFVVLPPWWETWWARCLLIALSLSIVYSLVKWRVYLVKLNEKELAIKVDEKTEELKQASESLAQLNTQLEQRVQARTAELQIEVNERKIAETKFFHLAFHDSLTGLPNREWLIKRIEALISRDDDFSEKKFGLMFLDGDRFKQINDTYGHTVGDELLIASGMRLSKVLKAHQYATRLGGDEFTVIVEKVNHERELEELASEIIEIFKEPFLIEKISIHFNMSVGVLLCDEKYSVTTSVLRDADIAMYHAKESGKGTYKIFDQEMRKVALELSQLEAELYNAVENQDFHLVYQPLLNLHTGLISGFEALIRWNHASRGNIPPDIFIPIAEETGLIIDIGEWVLRRACSQLKEWQKLEHLKHMSVSVNVSSNQLRGNDFLEVLDTALGETDLEGKYLKLELTESTLINNNQSFQDLLTETRNRNIELAIDDFGTGYSSLAYLNQLPVQHLKIDRKFIDAIDNTPNATVNVDALAIVKAAITLGQSLRMKVTAEGIETEVQLLELKKKGCDFAQGYFISKPMSSEDAVAFVETPVKFCGEGDGSSPLKKYQEELTRKASRLKKG